MQAPIPSAFSQSSPPPKMVQDSRQRNEGQHDANHLRPDADKKFRGHQPLQCGDLRLRRGDAFGKQLERIARGVDAPFHRRFLPRPAQPALLQIVPHLIDQRHQRFAVAAHFVFDPVVLLQQAGVRRLENCRRFPRFLGELLVGVLLVFGEIVEHVLPARFVSLRRRGLARLIIGRRPGHQLLVFPFGRLFLRLESFGELLLGDAKLLFGRGVAGGELVAHAPLGPLALGGKPREIGEQFLLNFDGKGMGHTR